MKKSLIQVDPRVYRTLDYIDKPRWNSYWQQMYEVNRTKPKKVLEIGIGNSIVAMILHQLGFDLTTVDFDNRLHPDFVADIRQLPFSDNTFDTVLCAEVLEHIPFSDFSAALKELHRVTKKYVIMTVPHDYLTYFYISFKLIPYVRPLSLFLTVPRAQKHAFDGQHYWEIGKRGYSLKRINQAISHAGLLIDKTYTMLENPNHRFFILMKGNR
ncbi:class I SAM-dependent methyltransferase [Candidatus Gottesmanbacteria bacterium]|nr:class I SAM-dependent methyltransferase [Candidatus Gottesmanbacteria bacterium]